MTQLVTFATVINVLSAPALGNGLLWMARAMSGEQGGCFSEDMQAEIGLWIAHTILNRVQHPDYPSYPEAVVRDGFYGHTKANDDELLVRMYLIARFATFGRTALRLGDPTDGCYFMYSLHDLADLGKSSDTAGKCFQSGEYGLCFFTDIP